MVTRPKIPLVALLLAAGASLPAVPRAQVRAPRLVEEGEEVQEEPAPPRRPPARPAPVPPAVAPAASPPGVAPRIPEAPAGARSPAAATAGAPAGSLPAPPSPPTTAADLARRIVPVQATYAQLMERWAERRTAQREQDPVRAEIAEKALLAARRELAIENLVPLAAVEVRESRRALASNLSGEAVAHALVAVQLAPAYPDAHLALARARFAQAPARVGAVLGALADAVGAMLGEPHTVRALWGDLFSAALATVFTGAMATALLLVMRRIRIFLHDFHHLPLLRRTAPVQASFLALVLLAIPLAFGLGPFLTVAVALLAVWLYLSTAERLVATAAVLAVLAMPWAAGEAARATAWTGTLAERVHDIEEGAISDEEAERLAADLAQAPGPAPLYAALGRHAKRRGNLPEALRLYRLAAAADERAPEVQVDIGNVLFLQGDLEGAKAAYLAATDRAGSDLEVLAAAHYDLSKLYLRTSDMEKSAAAREKAEHEAGAFLRRFGSDDDFSANRYLVDVPVPAWKIRALARDEAGADAVSGWIRQRLTSGLPRASWPWTGIVLLAAAWALSLLGGRKLSPSRECERCGGAACRRCDAGAGALCGQCVNVFMRKGVVDARDRLRKEAQVRRYEQFRQVATRILAIVGGGAGQLWDGATVRGVLLLHGMLFAAFLVWFWRGVTPPPLPSPYVLAGKLLVAAPLGLAIWALAVRDAFRRTQP